MRSNSPSPAPPSLTTSQPRLPMASPAPGPWYVPCCSLWKAFFSSRGRLPLSLLVSADVSSSHTLRSTRFSWRADGNLGSRTPSSEFLIQQFRDDLRMFSSPKFPGAALLLGAPILRTTGLSEATLRCWLYGHPSSHFSFFL